MMGWWLCRIRHGVDTSNNRGSRDPGPGCGPPIEGRLALAPPTGAASSVKNHRHSNIFIRVVGLLILLAARRPSKIRTLRN